jgi:hypothetical protein
VTTSKPKSEVSIHICRGSSSPTCRCECPDGPCEHVWDGEWIEEETRGGTLASVTCSRCGMRAIDHDMWAAP